MLYTGTLEPYQGLDLLLEALVAVVARHPATRLVVAGGRPEQVDELARRATSLGLSGRVELLGLVPSPLIPALEAAADVLVSPRSRGRNTPLKIFSYLRSGRPIVATDIASHTQVLDGETSILVPPTAAGLAEGLERVLAGEALARATAAASSVRATYGVDAYVRGVAAAYTHVGGTVPGPSEVAEATAVITGFGENARDDIECRHFVAELTQRPLGVAV